MKRILYSVILFIIVGLVSLSLDTIGYYIRYVPSDHYTYSQYFSQNELLTSAAYLAIVVVMTFNLFVWEKK